MHEGTKLCRHMETRETNEHDYRSLVGSLIYLTHFRPDFSFIVGCVSSFMTNPQVSHMDVARHILKYLKGTSTHEILFKLGNTQPLTGYVDDDWGRDADTWGSTIRMIFMLGGYPINWISKLQTIIVLLTTETEYRALSKGVKEVVWLKRLFTELQIGDDAPTKLYTDNQSSMKLVKKPSFTCQNQVYRNGSSLY